MKHVAFMLVLLYALAVVWPSAAAALTLLINVNIALRSAVLGFAAGLAFSLLVAYAWIYNRLVEADRLRDINKVNDQHDKRRI